MSRPSANSPRRKCHARKPSEKAPELREMVNGLLVGVRGWGLKLEAMSRQKYDPDAMAEVCGEFLHLYEFFAHLMDAAAKLPHPNPMQSQIKNAAEVLLFYQSPILEGCLNEKAAGETLDEFVDQINEIMGDEPKEEPDEST